VCAFILRFTVGAGSDLALWTFVPLISVPVPPESWPSRLSASVFGLAASMGSLCVLIMSHGLIRALRRVVTSASSPPPQASGIKTKAPCNFDNLSTLVAVRRFGPDIPTSALLPLCLGGQLCHFVHMIINLIRVHETNQTGQSEPAYSMRS
jgi:hypothetical protein